MTDHEAFVLLAAKQLSEPLSPKEEAELAAHLATCTECRRVVAGLRQDNIGLRAQLGTATVAPRVRTRVLEEAKGRRRTDRRLVLGLAAVLLLGALGASFIVGGQPDATPAPSNLAELPTADPTLSPAPSLAVAPSPQLSPSPSEPAVSPSPSRSAAYVAGSYVYGTRPPRRDTVAAQFVAGEPAGEWSRVSPADGSGNTYAGSITCLVIEGSTAWMAGPTTSATDGTEAALIVVHDGGRNGKDDTALMWLTRAGQTITTVENWCVNQFTPPGPPLPLTEGDIEVVDDSPAVSPAPSAAAAFVAAAYTYGQRPPRKDTVVARLEDGEPIGEWSRIMPADGSGDTWGGPVTCLVFDGSDVWLAGPATTATNGRKDGSAMIHLHDGGPGGENDSALIWLAPVGQTITTVTNWCLTKFEPADLSPLTDGDIEIQNGP
jgi:hypothetical protein